MKKTLTAALALSTFAGLALATSSIDTDPAGCLAITNAASTSSFIINPFDAFEGGLTLGDIDGSEGDTTDGFICVYNSNGKKLFFAKWRTVDTVTGWWTMADSNPSVFTNSHPLARGDSVQFTSGESEKVLYVAGTISDNSDPVYLNKNHNFVGNIAPVDKDLGLFSLSGAKYDPFSSCYVYVNGNKLVYLDSTTAGWVGLSGGWYLKSEINGPHPENATKQDTTIKRGMGFRVYCPQADGTASGVVLNCPGI